LPPSIDSSLWSVLVPIVVEVIEIVIIAISFVEVVEIVPIFIVPIWTHGNSPLGSMLQDHTTEIRRLVRRRAGSNDVLVVIP